MIRRSIAATLLAPFLLLVAALAAPAIQAGGGCHGNDGSVYTEGDATVIRMDVCSFSPTISRVPVGTTVRFLNTSTVEHAVAGRSATWGSAILPVGAEYSEAFDAAGMYPFSCPLHPGMVGAIVVGGDGAAQGDPADPAAAAVTSPDAEAVAATATFGATVGQDPMPLAIAGLAGLGIGAILGIFGAGAVATRRRDPTD